MAHLLKSLRNDVFRIITERGLKPSNFKWEIFADPNFDECHSIKYLDDHYFDFLSDGDSFRWEYSPGQEKMKEKSSPYNTYGWYNVKPEVYKWLENLKKEISEPDLWANLPETSDTIWDPSGTIVKNSHFSDNEITQIASALKKIREFLIQSNAYSTEEISLLNQKLDELLESSKRLGRKDWRMIAISTLLGISVALSLNPVMANELFNVASDALSHLYKDYLQLP